MHNLLCKLNQALLPLVLSLFCKACASHGFDDEDAVNQRRSYQQDDAPSLLPSPQQAANEVRQYQADEQERETTRRHLVQESDGPAPEDEGLSDMTAAYARVLVPERGEDQPNFAPVKGQQPQETNRRKPIYLGKLGFEVLEAQATVLSLQGAAVPEVGLGRRSYAMALAAKPLRNFDADTMGTYVVRPGDSLSTISVRIYGVSNRWMELAHLNRLGNGSIIFPKEILLYVRDFGRKPPQ